MTSRKKNQKHEAESTSQVDCKTTDIKNINDSKSQGPSAENLHQIFKEQLPRIVSVKYNPKDRVIITKVPLHPSCTSSLETLYFLPNRPYKESSNTQQVTRTGEPESISVPSKTHIPEVGFITVNDDLCTQYLEICSWIFTKTVEIHVKIKSAITILNKRVEINSPDSKLVDPSDEISEVEAWKFVIEESLRYIGHDDRSKESIKSLTKQISRDISACESRFSQLHHSAKCLFSILCSTQNRMQILQQEAIKKCSSVRKSIRESNLKHKEYSEDNFAKSSETPTCKGDDIITVRWSLDGISLKCNQDWIKLGSCIPYHKLSFIDLFSTQLGQFAEFTEILLTSSHDMLRRSSTAQSRKTDRNPDLFELSVHELLSKLFKILKLTKDIKRLTPKEKMLILNASLSMMSKIKDTQDDLKKLIKDTSNLQDLMYSLYKSKTELISNKSQTQHIVDDRLTFHLYSTSDPQLAGLFAGYAHSPDSSKEYHTRAGAGIHVEPSPPESFFSITSTTDLNQTEEVIQLPVKLEIFEPVNVEQEYINAVGYLQQTGTVDPKAIELCSDKVQLFCKNSNSLIDAYTENVDRLSNLLQGFHWGGHGNLPGLLFWSTMTATTFTLTKFRKTEFRYWNLKILGLILELREQSSWMISAFCKYTRFFKSEQNQLLFIGKIFSESDQLIRRKLDAGLFAQRYDVDVDEILPKFRVAESDESSTLRICVKGEPRDYNLILLSEKLERRKCSVVKFTESEPEDQFKIIKVGVDELFDRIGLFKLVFDKIRMDKTKGVKSALNGIFTCEDFKTLLPFEKSVIVYSMESVHTCFIRFNQYISKIRDIFDKYDHLVNVLNVLSSVTLQGKANEFLTEIIADVNDRDALKITIKELTNFSVVNYIPPKNSQTQKRLKDIVQSRQPITEESTERQHPMDARRRAVNVFYNHAQPLHQFEATSYHSDSESSEFDEEEWLRPLRFLGKLPPGPEPVEIPQPQQLEPPIIETRSSDPCEHLKTLVTKFSESLVNPTLRVLEAFHSPLLENLEKSIGYFQCLCFLITVGCAQLNTSKKIGQKIADEIRRQCLQLTRFIGQIQHQLSKARISIREKILVLSLAMKSNTKTALRKIHLNHTKDMEDCLNGVCGIMNEESAIFYILDNLGTADNNLDARGLKLYWEGSSTDEKLQVITLDKQIFDYSDLTLHIQLKILTDMTCNASRVLERVSVSLEDARLDYDAAFKILRSIADFTSEERSKRFKPEENHVMHRTIEEIIVISNVTFELIETTLTRANASLSQGFNLVFSKLQKKPEVSLFSDDRKPLLLYKTFTLTLESNWSPTVATVPKSISESNPETTKLRPSQLEKQIVPEKASPGFPQFISSLRRQLSQLGTCNLVYFRLIESVFKTPEDSPDPNLSGLFGLEILIGHAILEMTDLRRLAKVRKDDLKYSFNGTLSAVEYFSYKSFTTLVDLMLSTRQSVRKLIASLTIFDKKSWKKAENDSEVISKSTTDVFTNNGNTFKLPDFSPMNSVENWEMSLKLVGSKIQLVPLQGPTSKGQSFAGLSKDKQAEVTSRLLGVTTYRFQNTSEIIEKTVKANTQAFIESIGQLQTGLKDLNKMNTRELMECREVLNKFLRSTDEAKPSLINIQNYTETICERLRYINLLRKLRSMSAHRIQPHSKNHVRKTRIEKYIEGLHTAAISVRLPLDI